MNLMKSILILIISILWAFPLKSQQLTPENLASMVQLVDSHIDLSAGQEASLLEILRSSYNEVRAIQLSGDADVVKLRNMTLVQEKSDKELQKVFSKEQYKAYRNLMDGDGPAFLTYDEKVEALSDKLGLNDAVSVKFSTYLKDLDRTTQGIMVRGSGGNEVAIDLLTEILATDISLIGLLGKDKYAEFFTYRAAGALSDVASNETGSIEQVLLFYDLSKALNLTSGQSREIIAAILENESRLRSIRTEFGASPALMQEKLRLEEQKGLMRLQEILDDEQVELLLKLIQQ